MQQQIDASTKQYLRDARKLRFVYGDEPLKLHQNLQYLSRRQDSQKDEPAAEDSTEPLAGVCSAPPRAISAFRKVVERHLQAGLISYSSRVHLMRDARCRGIGRFEANLIIAAVQHQSRYFPAIEQPARGWKWDGAVMFLTIQLMLAMGLYWLFRVQ